MIKPILLLGPAGSGKTFNAATIASLYEAENVLIVNSYDAERLTNFLKDGKVIKLLIVEEVPDEKTLRMLNDRFIGIARGTMICPRVVFTSNSVDTVSPLPEFHKIICSYNLYSDKYETH